MSCLFGWSYGAAISNTLLPMIKTAVTRRWTSSGHSNTWNGTYEGSPVSITFQTKQSTLAIYAGQENALFVTVPFSGTAELATFSGTIGVLIDLNTLSIQFVPSAAANTWDEYLNLTDTTLALSAPAPDLSANLIYPYSCIPSSASASVYDALVASFTSAFAGYGADSPVYLGTYAPDNDDSGKLSSATKDALTPLLTQFITLNYASATDAQLVVLSAVADVTPPTGSWQASLISAGTFNPTEGATAMVALADTTLWNLVALQGPTVKSDKLSISYAVSDASPSVLTVTLLPNAYGPEPWSAMGQFGWSFVLQASIPGPDLQMVLKINCGYSSTYEYDMTLAIIENADGTETLEASWTSGGDIITFNPGAAGPVLVETVIAETLALAISTFNPYLLIVTILEVIAAAIWYAVLYDVLDKIGGRVPKTKDVSITEQTYTFENMTVSAYPNSFVLQQGLIIGAYVAYENT